MDNFVNKLHTLDVEVKDEALLNKYLHEKSVYRYNLILDQLLKAKRKICDNHLHDFYKYDLRVRRLLFKYLTPYEIKLRAKVLNENSQCQDYIENLDFGRLIKEFYNNDEDHKKVKKLRNYVFHHRMLQLCPMIEIIEGINSMLKKLDKSKFISELNNLSENLLLIYRFKVKDDIVEYDLE